MDFTLRQLIFWSPIFLVILDAQIKFTRKIFNDLYLFAGLPFKGGNCFLETLWHGTLTPTGHWRVWLRQTSRGYIRYRWWLYSSTCSRGYKLWSFFFLFCCRCNDFTILCFCNPSVFLIGSYTFMASIWCFSQIVYFSNFPLIFVKIAFNSYSSR